MCECLDVFLLGLLGNISCSHIETTIAFRFFFFFFSHNVLCLTGNRHYKESDN